jgi:signal peptide peptidase SppA
VKLLDVLNAPWAILPEKKREIDEIYATHLRGDKIDLKAIEARLERPLNNQKTKYDTVNGVAVLDVEGVIAKKMNLFTAISGGVSTELLGQTFQMALEDPAVTAILLLVDSPGGSVDGPPALADQIYAARGRKPIVALADGMMASAAYWISAGASQVYAASRTTLVGSIGVVATHLDVSGAEAQRGIKTTEIVSGKYKRMASQYGPLSVEGRQSIQDQTDFLYSVFLDAVTKFRGAASSEAVHAEMADGRTFFADQALDVGMVDGIATVDELIARLAAGEQFVASRPSTLALPAVSRRSSTNDLAAAGDAAHPDASTMETHMPEEKKTLTADEAKALTDAALGAQESTLKATFAAQLVTQLDAKAKEATLAERARIKSILEIDAMLPGHRDRLVALAFDGETTEAVAMKVVVKAEGEKKLKLVGDLHADGGKPAAHAVSTETGKPETGKPEDEKKKAIDPVATARKAQTWKAEQHKLGITVSAAEAVAHVTAEEAK